MAIGSDLTDAAPIGGTSSDPDAFAELCGCTTGSALELTPLSATLPNDGSACPASPVVTGVDSIALKQVSNHSNRQIHARW